MSFSFDDFPRSAFTVGGAILRDHDARGTYFTSALLLGGDSPSGPIATADLVEMMVGDGHELGCHTYEHLDGTTAEPDVFVRSIAMNHEALNRYAAELPVFAFPLEGPTLAVKREVGRHFRACRGGGQRHNAGTIDLHLLQSFFLDWKSRDNVDAIARLIERNAEERGWLIFSTHDVAADPSPYGCTPHAFARVVELASRSGARMLPVGRVCDAIGVSTLSAVECPRA